MSASDVIELFPDIESLALRCDPAGLILEVLQVGGARGDHAGGLREARSLREMLDPDSHQKMTNFLAEAGRAGLAAGWEMTVAVPSGLRTMTFAAVADGRGFVVAGGLHSAGLLELLRSSELSRGVDAAIVGRFRQAALAVRSQAMREPGLLDELTRLHNELAGFQRELAKTKVRLESQREWLWSILSGLQEAVIIADKTGIVTFANEAALRLTGRQRSLCLGEHIEQVLALSRGGQAVEALDWLGEVLRSGTTRIVAGCDLLPESGPSLPVSGSLNPVRDSDGKPSDVVFVLRDLTEALRMQELVVDAKRMEISREIAAGVAHNVNNLLAVISGNAEVLALRHRGEEHEIQAIQNSVQRAVDLTSRLLSFTGQATRIVGSVEVNDLLRAAVRQAGPYPAGVQVTMGLAESPCIVHGDSSSLSVVFRDILANAREAISGTGRITITTSIVPRIQDSGPPGASVLVSIRDDGCGMNPGVQSRLLEPFFSTKFLGRGLGLPSAHGIIMQHEGRLDVESQEGSGTTVTVTLPLEEYKGR